MPRLLYQKVGNDTLQMYTPTPDRYTHTMTTPSKSDRSSYPSLSIIIAAYNNHRWLRLVLEGLRHQTYRKFQIIVADDGSDGHNTALLRQYMHDHPELDIRKDLLDINGFDERYLGPGLGEDIDIAYRLRFNGCRIMKVPHQALTIHRYHTTSVSTVGSRSDNNAILEDTKRRQTIRTPYGIAKAH